MSDGRMPKIQGVPAGRVIAWWSGPSPGGAMKEVVGFLLLHVSYQELPTHGQRLLGKVLWALHYCDVNGNLIHTPSDVPEDINNTFDKLLQLVASLMPEDLGLCSNQCLGIVSVVQREVIDGKAVWHTPCS